MARLSIVFAFGSNLDAAQMRKRCPSATLIGAAWLKKHRLAFVGKSRAWGGGGVATVQPNKRSVVAGAVYAISRADLLTLDSFEGTPWCYQRSKVPVLCRDRMVGAWIYRHNSDVEREPVAAYTGRILRGYRALQIPKHALYAAVRRARQAEMDAEQEFDDTPFVESCDECNATWVYGEQPNHGAGCSGSISLMDAADNAAINRARVRRGDKR